MKRMIGVLLATLALDAGTKLLASALLPDKAAELDALADAIVESVNQ